MDIFFNFGIKILIIHPKKLIMKLLKSIPLFALFVIVGFASTAQINWNSPLPTDQKVVIGELENGMRYYIRQNAEPKERAEFYIVFNAGAMLEDDDQDGLAHFTEHMAFNGTKNYPDKGVLNFLENIGVKFGHNVNAFTSQDITAYNLSNVPLTRETIIDSALLILHDWSSYISFDKEEIDAERGVIREEWRTRRTSDWRTYQARMGYLYKGSKYAERDVIGKVDIIDNFKYETITRFYNDWYRPDMQALILVGDFDPKMMESKVKELFSKIPRRENAKPRPEFDVPDNKEPIIGIFTDPEASRTMVELYYKHPAKPFDQKNLGYYRSNIVENLYAQMINARLDELRQKENPAFVMAYSYYGSLVRTKSAYVSMAIAREGDSQRAIKSLFEENFRLVQHGFTQSELDRAKADLLRSIENDYNERDKVKNQNLIREYMSHFTQNEPIPGIEFDFMFTKSILPSISLEEVSAKAKEWVTDENMVVFISASDKENSSLPTAEKVLEIYKEVKKSNIEPYKDNVSSEPLISKTPKVGKVKKTLENKVLGTTEWTLSNGVKVIIKPTNFKEDEVLLSAYSSGGFSLVADNEVPTAQFAASIAMMSGVSNFSKIELDKMLAGKLVSVMPYIGEFEEGLSGSSSPKDIEMMMQLVHLYFTAPRFDETAFSSTMSQMQAMLQNSGSNPNMIFRDSINFFVNNRHIRKRPMNLEMLKEVDFKKMETIYKNRFADASDFTFVFVGNVDAQMLKPLVETYLASLPNIKRKETWKDNKVRFPEGKNYKPFQISMQVPKGSCFVAYQNKAEYNYQNILLASAIEHVLDLRYTETIREKEGGTYGVSARISISKYPINQVMVNMFFDTDPAKADHLIGIIHSELEKIIKEGPTEVDLNKAREYFLKTRQERLRENRFWSSAIKEYYSNGVDMFTGYEAMVQNLKSAEVQKAAQRLFNNANMLQVIMGPAQQ
jgi:zinc protease